MDPSETYHVTLFNKVSRLMTPLSLKRPSSIHVGRMTATNDISHAFSELNELLIALGIEPVKYIPYIDELREPETDRRQVTAILLKCKDIFSRKRGKAYHTLRCKLEELGLVIPESRRLKGGGDG